MASRCSPGIFYWSEAQAWEGFQSNSYAWAPARCHMVYSQGSKTSVIKDSLQTPQPGRGLEKEAGGIGTNALHG